MALIAPNSHNILAPLLIIEFSLLFLFIIGCISLAFALR